MSSGYGVLYQMSDDARSRAQDPPIAEPFPRSYTLDHRCRSMYSTIPAASTHLSTSQTSDKDGKLVT